MIVIPTGFAQVTLDFQIPAPGGSKVASTTFGVSNNPGPTLISAICDVYNDTVWQVVGTVRGRMIGGTIRDSVSTYEHVMDEPGTVAIALPPPNVSLLVKKVSSGAGRKNRGRMYPPGCVYENTYDDSGEMNSTDLADYNAAFADFLAALETLDAEMVILHNDETAPSPIGALAVQSIASTQRRRLR